MFFPRFILVLVALVLGVLGLLTHGGFFGLPGRFSELFVAGALALLSFAALYAFVLTFGYRVVGRRVVPKENSFLAQHVQVLSESLTDNFHFCTLYTYCVRAAIFFMVIAGGLWGACLLLLDDPIMVGVVFGGFFAVIAIPVALFLAADYLSTKKTWWGRMLKRTCISFMVLMVLGIALGLLTFVGDLFIVEPVSSLHRMGYSLSESIWWYAKIIALAVGAVPLCILLRKAVLKLPARFSGTICPVVHAGVHSGSMRD